jgi:hypothetical protein
MTSWLFATLDELDTGVRNRAYHDGRIETVRSSQAIVLRHVTEDRCS